MITYRNGDVVLVEFLHSDWNTSKKRPALVILDTGDQDVILAPITSQRRGSLGDCTIKDWIETGLIKESTVRLAKIACFNKSQVIRTLGQLSPNDETNLKQQWQQLFC